MTVGHWISLIIGLAALVFFVLTYKASKSGSEYQDQVTGKKVTTPGNVNITTIGWFWWGVLCAVVGIIFFIIAQGER